MNVNDYFYMLNIHSICRRRFRPEKCLESIGRAWAGFISSEGVFEGSATVEIGRSWTPKYEDIIRAKALLQNFTFPYDRNDGAISRIQLNPVHVSYFCR